MSDEIDRDIDWLLANPDGSMGSKYHDAGACWQLIERFRERLAVSEARDEADAQNSQNAGATVAADLLAEIARTGEHPGVFGGEAMETAAQTILEIHRRADQAILRALGIQQKAEAVLKERMLKKGQEKA